MTVTGLSGTPYRLGAAPIGSGGEGDIFPVQGNGSTVAKIYKLGAVPRELEEKLRIMTLNPPSKSVLSQVAWPLDVAYSSAGKCVGFVMPRLSINAELGEVYKYPYRLPFSALQKINIAQNICAVISEVHKAGYVFGDFNPRNIGLDKNTGLVSFLDTDTYHVADKTTGGTYRCNVCAPGYAAPELLQRCSDYVAENPSASKNAYAETPLPTFTKETDNFALAIHVFKLLMNGFTPFGGIIETASVSQSSPGVGDAAVRRDSYCFKPGFKHQSSAILPLEAFPQEIADLFTRAFIVGKHDPRQRPDAVQWHGALTKLGQNMRVCNIEPLHYYFRENSTCPLCEADERYAEAIGQGASSINSQPTLSQTMYANPEQTTSTAGSLRMSGIQPNPRSNMGKSTFVQGYAKPVVKPQMGNRSLPAGFIWGTIIFLAITAFFVLMWFTRSDPSPVPDPPPPPLVVESPLPATEDHAPPSPATEDHAPPSPATEDHATPPVVAQVAVGEIIRFGNYDWRVLDVQGNLALIITDRVIDHRMYYRAWEAVTWERSEIRRWLNGEFFASLSPADQARVVETYVVNNDNPWDFSDWDGWVNTPGGNNTRDRIFLLSINEVLRYFGDSGLVARGAAMGAIERRDSAIDGLSDSAVNDQFSQARRALDLNGSVSCWWLRSPGRTPSGAVRISDNGLLNLGGSGVFWPGEGGGGVRPALWLSLLE